MAAPFMMKRGMESSVIPTAMKPYGIQSGGAHADDVVWPSTIASRSSVHDFQEYRVQNRKETASARATRQRFTRGGSTLARAAIPTWPRCDWTYAPERNVAPTMRNTDASSCQSVGTLRT